MCIGFNKLRILFLIITYLIFIPLGNSDDFSIYKSTCSDIGFTPDTEPFADCVLELYKRDRAKLKQKEENKKQANYEKERLRIEKERLQIEKDRDKREAEEKEALAEAIRKENLRMMIDRIFTPPSRGRLNCDRYPNVDGSRNCWWE